METYDHHDIEAKWQKKWETEKLYETKDNVAGKENYYALVEYPYPSGNLHTGHWYAFAVPDIYARFKRMKGFNVMFPFGYDSFGLPAENAAIKNGADPRTWTNENIDFMTEQVKRMGNMFDWSRKVVVSEPDYYKWTQWLFLEFYKRGLAYKKSAQVNWCPKDQTVLANEQVIGGLCERCETPVVQKELEQWFFKITDYADRLIDDLDDLNWPEEIKQAQRNWIGKSEGAELSFELQAKGAKKPHVVLIHGHSGDPSHIFQPWLKKTLEEAGHTVEALPLPDATCPPVEKQAAFVLENCSIDENTIIIGHSFGTAVGMKVIEQLKHPIKQFISLGGFIDDSFKDGVDRCYDFDWNFDFQKIITNAPVLTLLHADDDFAISDEQTERLASALETTYQVVHVNDSHFQGDEEPAIFDAIKTSPEVSVFTTRADTLFGATFMVLAPEHRLIEQLKDSILNWSEVEAYIEKARNTKEIERTAEGREKTGVKLEGVTAINPASKEEIPVFIADYVLVHYGTGAIMAVPAHDERDFAFAQKYDIPVKQVIEGDQELPFSALGKLINSKLEDAPKRKKNHIIFDFDGVLARSHEIHIEALAKNSVVKDANTIEEARAWINRYSTSKPDHGKDVSQEKKDYYTRLTEEQGDLVKGKIELYQEFLNEIKKIPDTTVAIVTTGTEKYVTPALEQTDIKFTHVLTFEDHHSKEEKVEHICKDWGIDLDEVIYVTDTPLDVYELEGALGKQNIIGCTWGYTTREELREALPPSQIIVHPDEIHRFFAIPENFNGMESEKAKEAITGYVGGIMKSTYKLRDWLLSRQRYWGCPIPIVYDPEGNPHAVPDEHLPWILPEDVDFQLTGKSPLETSKELVERTEKTFGKGWTPEVDTMDTFVDSSWYFLRYCDPQNEGEFANKEKLKQWMPVDRYSGGAEHTTMHVLYSRFFHKALFDMGYVNEKEPYSERMNRGLIMAEDGRKMSKRWGNVVDPDEQVKHVGADAVKMYLAFIGPFNQTGHYPWSTNGLVGTKKYLERVWRLRDKIDASKTESSEETERLLHQTIKKVGEDIEAFKFNTAISQLMILQNHFEKNAPNTDDYATYIRLLAPFAPHLSEELWELIGRDFSVHLEEWPVYDPEKLLESTITWVVQVNGRIRAKFDTEANFEPSEAEKRALSLPETLKWTDGSPPKKVIVVPNKLINIVI